MFSGIVAAVGRIVRTEPLEDGLRLSVEAGALDLSDVSIGDSIAVAGVCLTVISVDGRRFGADVSRETLRCTTGLDATGEVNLEKALRLSDRLGGHLVSGHVDGVAEVLRFDAAGESRSLVVRAPADAARFVARKGSVAIDGVSLTVNRVEGREFGVNLIPHTIEATTLKRLAPGAWVNLEIDLIARYVERILAETAAA
ncbi:MAG: riboflavin synthase [Rhodocyclaceae bacterium]